MEAADSIDLWRVAFTGSCSASWRLTLAGSSSMMNSTSGAAVVCVRRMRLITERFLSCSSELRGRPCQRRAAQTGNQPQTPSPAPRTRKSVPSIILKLYKTAAGMRTGFSLAETAIRRHSRSLLGMSGNQQLEFRDEKPYKQDQKRPSPPQRRRSYRPKVRLGLCFGRFKSLT